MVEVLERRDRPLPVEVDPDRRDGLSGQVGRRLRRHLHRLRRAGQLLVAAGGVGEGHLHLDRLALVSGRHRVGAVGCVRDIRIRRAVDLNPLVLVGRVFEAVCICNAGNVGYQREALLGDRRRACRCRVDYAPPDLDPERRSGEECPVHSHRIFDLPSRQAGGVLRVRSGDGQPDIIVVVGCSCKRQHVSGLASEDRSRQSCERVQIKGQRTRTCQRVYLRSGPV